MRMHSRAALAAALALVVATPGTALATNGYFLIGYGAKSRAMGGVGIALGQDGLAAAANPAAMIEVPSQVNLDAEFFYPRRAVYHNSSLLPADSVSDSNQFLIPAMGGVFQFNRKMTIGMAVVGAGLGTRYDQHIPPGKGSYFFNVNGTASPTVGVSMMQMQMLPSVAYRVSDHNTIGMSIALAVQQFRAYGLQSFGTLGFTSANNHFTNEGNDWSYGGGIRLGWLGQFFNNRLSLGVNYASRVYMTHFRKYRNLFAQHGSFDIPPHFGVGIAVKPTDRLTMALDVERIMFNEVNSVGNPGPVPSGGATHFFPPGCTPATICTTGQDKGLGFGWRAQTVYKIGASYKVNDKWTVRAGYNYGKSPIPSDQILFNFLAPATVQEHITLGFTYDWTPNMDLSVNFMHAIKHTIRGKTNFWPVGVTNFSQLTQDNAAISMYQYSLGAELTYKF